MPTISELVDKSDILVQGKDNVNRILHQLGYELEDAVGKAFFMIAKKDMTDAGMSIAHADAILAEVEPLQGDLLCVALICGMWLICRVRTHCKLVGH